ncbi:MAG: hypothetical protein CMQ40_01195 [Gammaproteobacteria bacterium]|nr:hypothetical protein [Gammaproteobacteria bacterium]
MSSSPVNPHIHSYSKFFAILVGFSIPSLAFGRAVFATVIGLALIFLVMTPLFRVGWQTLIENMRTFFGVLIILVIFSWSISAIGSDFPGRSFEASARTGLFIAIAVFIYAALSHDNYLSTLCLKSLILTTFVASGFALLASSMWPEIYWVQRLKGWQSTPLETEFKGYSSLIVLLTPLLLIGMMRFNTLWKVSALAGITMLFSIMLLSVNRSAIAGLLSMAMIFSLTQFFRPKYQKKAIVICTGFLIILMGFIFWLRYARSYIFNHPHFLHSGIVDANWVFPIWLIDFQRQTIWKFAIGIWEKAPWLGIGPNTINFLPDANTPLPGDETLRLIPAHPHNWVVEVLAETGAFGFCAVLLAIVVTGIQWIRRYADNGDLATLSLILISGGYWGSGLFNFSYWSAWWQLSFFIALAVSLALAQDRKL